MNTTVALERTQSLLTTGARAAAVLLLQAAYWIAIPQLAKDIPNTAPNLYGRDTDVPLLLYRTNEHNDQLDLFSHVSVPGAEDAELFTINDRIFLATARICNGSFPNIDFVVDSCIFEWNGKEMQKFQCIPTSGAKQWRAFDISGRHFLALAQGLEDMPGVATPPKRNSTIYEWNGEQFEEFQVISPSIGGYNWLHFTYNGHEFLAYADHVAPTRLFQWNGYKFEVFQTFNYTGSRAFSFYEHGNKAYLATAYLDTDSIVYRWIDNCFEQFQVLPGKGGRELTWFNEGTSSYLVLVHELLGDPTKNPQTALNSSVYQIQDDGVHLTLDFPTFGATDVKSFSLKDQRYLLVTESLTQDLRFRQDSHLYRFISPSTSASTSPVNNTYKTRNPSRISRKKKRTTTKRGSMMKRDAYITPEFASLFSTYAGGSPTSLGLAYRTTFANTTISDPLLAITDEYIVLYPGNGSDPAYFGLRTSTQGFIEITSISHLGPAIASLAQLKAYGKEWQSYAQTQLNAIKAVKAVNSESLWKDKIQVETYKGREASIAAMINYACDYTIFFLNNILADPAKLSPEYVVDNFLQGQTPVVTPNVSPNATISMACSDTPTANSCAATNVTSAWNGTISFNEIMIATFYLSSMDTAVHMQRFLATWNLDWKRAQVLINGGAGRETAAVTLSSNTMAMMLMRSYPDLPKERIFIAPQGPTPDIEPNSTVSDLKSHEDEFRSLWGATLGFSHLGAQMFPGFPKYKPEENLYSIINKTTTELSEPPEIMGPDDWFSLITRLRVTCEDWRQTLSAAVADFAALQLAQNKFDPNKVVISGLDGYDYINRKRLVKT